jgi:chromosome partitioning protein
MYTVVLASQKGGSGKTTLSGHLAVEADRMGAGPVALIDTDPQGSLAQWWNARAQETPHFVKVGLFDLEEALAHLAKTGFKLAIIDTPPAITDQISHVVAHADLVVVPTRPSPHDLRAVGATVDIAERHGKPLIFVVNGATARARITGEAAVALSQHGTVAPVTLHHRVDFAASMVDGRTVGEVVPKSQSAKEVNDLWIYVQDRLSRLLRDPDFVPEHKPAEMAVSPLSPLEDVVASEDEKVPEMMTSDELPPLVITEDYQGPDRRDGEDRRDFTRPLHYGPSEKRVHMFGRRATDRPQPFGRSGLGSGTYK